MSHVPNRPWWMRRGKTQMVDYLILSVTLHVFICRRRQDKQFDIVSLCYSVSPLPAPLPLLHLYMVFLPLSSSFLLLFAHTLLFPHTGSLIQVPMTEKGKITRGRLGSLSLKKEGERQCFLFSKHLIICTRGSGGKLHLTKVKVGL